jgi:hypothetical protein
MASEYTPSPAPAPTPSWFARLGLSGKLLAIGGLAGIIIAFLPLASVSVQMQGPGGVDPLGLPGTGLGTNQMMMSADKTLMVVENWRGTVGLFCYLAALVLAFVLYPPMGLVQKNRCLAALGAGVLVGVLAIWLLLLALNSGNTNLMGMGSIKATVGIGAFLNVVAGAAVAIGGFLKAREEKLI